MNYSECLCLHLCSYPDAKAQDVVKFTYQAAYGAEHLLLSPTRAREYLIEEFDRTESSNLLPISEPLNEKYCRVNIAAWKARGLNCQLLWEVFLKSASIEKKRIPDRDFALMIHEATQKISEYGFETLSQELSSYAEEYLSEGVHPVHHSVQYSTKYHPAYRVINKDYLPSEIIDSI